MVAVVAFSYPPLCMDVVEVVVVRVMQFSNHRPSGPMLSISRNVHMFVCLCVFVSVCLFTFEVPFNGLFAPTSRSRMSNIFRDSESLGKSNEKIPHTGDTNSLDRCG